MKVRMRYLDRYKKYKISYINNNIPNMIANDIAYGRGLVITLQKKIKYFNLLISSFGSTNSKNVVNTVKYEKEVGAKSIVIVGY